MATSVSGPRKAALGPQRQTALRLLRLWYLEMASLVAAVGIVAAILIILINFNGQQLPHWRLPINFNTAISLLTLCLRTALIIITAEIISQSKWTWFSDRTHQLTDFQTFDQASRGLVGSIKLLSLLRFGHRGSPLAVGASITAIVSLAISPFTQQAIKTESCLRHAPSNIASFPVAIYSPATDFASRDNNGFMQPGFRTQNALVSSIMVPHGNSSAIQPMCPTGNCTFPEPFGVPHSTMGLCAQCVDSTSLLKHRSWQDQSNLTSTSVSFDDLELTANDVGRVFAVGRSNQSYAESILPPEFKYAAEQSCANVSILTFSSQQHDKCISEGPYGPECAIAASCTLYACMKDIQVEVINGQVEERVVNTVPARARVFLPESDFPDTTGTDHFVVKSPCVVDGELYDTANFSRVPIDLRKRTFTNVTVNGGHFNVPSDCLYTMEAYFRLSFQYFMYHPLFNGECDIFSGTLNCTPWWNNQIYREGQVSFETINSAFQQFATSMTNFLRVEGAGTIHKNLGDLPVNKAVVFGEASMATVCLRLHWLWLLLPIITCFATAMLLIAILRVNATSGNQPMWKSSTLPLLFLGLEAWQRREEKQRELEPWDETQQNEPSDEHESLAERPENSGRDEPMGDGQQDEPMEEAYPEDLGDLERRARYITATLDLASVVLRPSTRQDEH